MRRLPLHMLLWACLLTVLLYAEAQAAEARLIKTVALTHPGVSAPVESAKSLHLWSNRHWPQWPVESGQLSPRGARLVTVLWQELLPHFRQDGLLPDAACLRAVSSSAVIPSGARRIPPPPSSRVSVPSAPWVLRPVRQSRTRFSTLWKQASMPLNLPLPRVLCWKPTRAAFMGFRNSILMS